MQLTELISNAYQWQRDLYKDVVASFVSSCISGKEYPQPTISTCRQCVSPTKEEHATDEEEKNPLHGLDCRASN
jgi:hypothetical protein